MKITNAKFKKIIAFMDEGYSLFTAMYLVDETLDIVNLTDDQLTDLDERYE